MTSDRCRFLVIGDHVSRFSIPARFTMNFLRTSCVLFGGLMAAVGVSEEIASACERCGDQRTRCEKCETERSPSCACDKLCEHAVAAKVPTTKNAKHSATLIVKCPAESRVTVDGHVTYATGATRQFQLLFNDDVYPFRVEIRLRDNEEEATYLFDKPLKCRPNGRIVMSVDRDQMQKVRDKASASDGTCTALDVLEAIERMLEKVVGPAPQPIAGPQPSPWKQAVAQHEHDVNEATKKVNELQDKLVVPKRTHNAAVQRRKDAEDTHQIKIAEVNAKTATLVDLVKAEVAVKRAREAEQSAKEELDAAQHELNKARERLTADQAALDLIKRDSLKFTPPRP